MHSSRMHITCSLSFRGVSVQGVSVQRGSQLGRPPEQRYPQEGTLNPLEGKWDQRQRPPLRGTWDQAAR